MRRIGHVLVVAYFVGASVCSTGDDSRTRDARTESDAVRAARDASRVSCGYVLFSPLLSTATYLIDKNGAVVHTWASDFAPGASAYLLDSGHLLRPARDPALPFFTGGGQGGRIEEFTWEGERVWNFLVGSSQTMQHHDAAPLPNGNVLVLVWERKSREESIRAGRRPELLTDAGLWPDGILEIAPERPTGGRLVWEWHVWDHLIQDHDPRARNYGRPFDHPELVDVNGDAAARTSGDEVLERIQALGYLARGVSAPDLRADHLHTNSIAYNASLDQIALSVSRLNELWVIDHGTTRAEAAGHAGGRAGRGGDLLYRWGNPQIYGRGTREHQRLFGQHDVRWVPPGLPGAGNLMIFDNGAGRPGGDYSSILEIAPPVDKDGRYRLEPGAAFGPHRPTWTYTAAEKRSFFADFISGAHRLPNGNTLICSGPAGRFLEVTPRGDTVWEYRNPFSGDAPNPSGDPPRSVFRATEIPPGHPGLAGRTLTPLVPQPHQHDSRRTRSGRD